MNNSMNDMMDFISLVCSIYCIYTWVRLLVKKELFTNGLLVPKDKKPADCLDAEGYIAYMRPRIGILAITLLIFTAFSAVNTRLETPILGFPWSIVPWAVEAGILFWFAACSSHAVRDYF